MQVKQLTDCKIGRKVREKLCFTLCEGYDSISGQKYFLKILLDEMTSNKSNACKFLSNAEHLKLLQLDSVSQIYSSGFFDGRYVIVSEFVEMQPLNVFIKERFPLNLKKAVTLVNEVAGTLRNMHLKGYIHGMLNPSSIFLGRRGVKLDDLGFYWCAPYLLKKENLEAGYLSYFVSPEIFLGNTTPDGRADQYSLAVIFLMLLTNGLSVKTDCHGSFKQKELLDLIPKIKELYPKSYLVLKELLTKSLQNSPYERFMNMREFIAELKKIPDETPQWRPGRAN